MPRATAAAPARTVVDLLRSRSIAVPLICLFLALLSANIALVWTPHSRSILYEKFLPSIPGSDEQRIGRHAWRKSREPTAFVEVDDGHPVRKLMHKADGDFEAYNGYRSKTFKEAVRRYRKQYGRHPPPSFKEWYKFAREHKVHNIDDFQQINDDLRPFWSVPAKDLRRFAAHASDEYGDLVAVISLRNHQVFQELWGWRSETFVRLLHTVARWLPDMDIPINRMDQPRVIVPWEDMQRHLVEEERTRSLDETGVEDRFTHNTSDMYRPRSAPEPSWLNRWNPFSFPKEHGPDVERPSYGWFNYAGSQLMDLASKSCPPESFARSPRSKELLKRAEESYKHDLGGLITNFNASSDLCTVGPQLAHLHGILYASTSMTVTHKLVPIFGECKLNVNNDILFPANMYWKKDKRYDYNDVQDINWDDKDDTMVWRGVTSGGNVVEGDPQRWRNMHRHRLVLLTNSTELGDQETTILAIGDQLPGHYTEQPFRPATFAHEHTDVGFTEKLACIPNCDFYNSSLTMLNKTTFAETFKSKYLIDVDGHSFSGRWRAFLQSRSLGLKATIFREWHDSRLFAWRHFVPLDNRYDDLYSLLTYFIGLNPSGTDDRAHEKYEDITVWRHDYEALRMARQGREWAAKVLRPEDIEIYLFRLLLEYGRIIDDNRDKIGFVGDGGEEMELFDQRVPAVD